MMATYVEYAGFTAKVTAREYTLRVREAAGDPHDFTRAIKNEAFLSRRVRYRDAPDICCLKLRGVPAARAGGLPRACVSVTDAHLEECRTAHAPKPPQRRPKAPPRA